METTTEWIEPGILQPGFVSLSCMSKTVHFFSSSKRLHRCPLNNNYQVCIFLYTEKDFGRFWVWFLFGVTCSTSTGETGARVRCLFHRLVVRVTPTAVYGKLLILTMVTFTPLCQLKSKCQLWLKYSARAFICSNSIQFIAQDLLRIC